jgi:hypothetical protein
LPVHFNKGITLKLVLVEGLIDVIAQMVERLWVILPPIREGEAVIFCWRTYWAPSKGK